MGGNVNGNMNQRIAANVEGKNETISVMFSGRDKMKRR